MNRLALVLEKTGAELDRLGLRWAGHRGRDLEAILAERLEGRPSA